jgi:hypothetical protein
MFIFLSSDSLLQYGRGDLEVPGQVLVSLQIPDVVGQITAIFH